MVKIPPSEAHKYVSPKVGHDVDKTKTKGQAFGKVVENLGKIALTKWHRITHFVGTLIKERKFDWVNDAEVLEQLTDRVKELGKDIKGVEPKQRDEAELKEINEDIPALVTKLRTSGVKGKLGEELLINLHKLGLDVKEDLRRLKLEAHLESKGSPHLELNAPPSQRGTLEVEEKTQPKRARKDLIGTHRGAASSRALEVEKRTEELKVEGEVEKPKQIEKKVRFEDQELKKEQIRRQLQDETPVQDFEEEFDLDVEEGEEVIGKEGEEIEEEGEEIEEEAKEVERAPVDERTAKRRVQQSLKELVEMAEKHGLKKSLSKHLSKLGLGSISKDNVQLNYFLNQKSYENLNKKQAIDFANKVLDLVEKGLEQNGVLFFSQQHQVMGNQDLIEALAEASRALNDLQKLE